jgi:integrase
MGANKAFAVYEKKHASGSIGYRVDLGLVGGKRTFKSFSNRADAEAFQGKCLKGDAHKNPLVLSDIDAITRHEVLAALGRLREYRASITEAVDFFLKHARPVRAEASIQMVMDEFKSVKTKGGLSAKYLTTAWHSFFVPFRDHFKNCLITNVTADGAEKYIYQHKRWNATTRATHIRHLNVLFNFAISRGHATLNPLSKIQRPKRPSNNAGEKVMTVEQVIDLLQYAFKNDYKKECAALVLTLFCGVRVDEVRRLRWAKIKINDEIPVVVLDETKANRRRVNVIPKNAVEWLKQLQEIGRVTADNHEGRMRWMRRAAKSKYHQNSARISFASYHVAMYEDPAKTSLLLGHQNPALLWNTYRALVSKSDAQRYWDITPNYDGKGTTGQEPSEMEMKKQRATKLAQVATEE